MFGPNWWKDFPCPLHPSWKLCDISEIDLHTLKQNVDSDENESMMVELAIYRAFLEFPKGTFLNQGRNNPTEALTYLGVAEEYVSTKYQNDIAAVIGYGIIINTFHMWIRTADSAESLLRDLTARKDDYPNHESYIHIVQAYILSRLGPRWRNKALSLYQSALNRFPDNCEWLFGKALMLGREARQIGFIKSWKNRKVKEAFQEEKRVLKQILDIDPDFHLARAFYGQVLFCLNESGAENKISKALEEKPENHTIAMVAARFYRRNNQFNKAEIILKEVQETFGTAETSFQLGLVYRMKARSVQYSKKHLLEIALKHFNNGVQLNECHYPCYTKRAEMTALIGQTKRAHQLFQDLFEHVYVYKDKPYLAKDEMRTITTALEMHLPRHNTEPVFSTTEEIKLLHRYITLATDEELITLHDSGDNSAVELKIMKYLQMLNKIVSDQCEKDSIRRLASLKLADASRRLGNVEEATKLFTKLYRNVEAVNIEGEMLFGLGKCYYNQQFYDKAIVMAIKLERMRDNMLNAIVLNEHTATATAMERERLQNIQLNAHELYADVHLSVAKSEMARETGSPLEDISCRLFLMEYLEHAIDMGSLEACYLFLTKVNNLHQHYFSLELRIPEILAKIHLVCENDRVRNVHTHFKLTLSDGSEIIHDVMTKRNEIIEKVNKLLRYEAVINGETCSLKEVIKEYKQLQKLRRTRLKFEHEILKRKDGENWNDGCKEKLTEVLQIARVLLDHIVHIYQTLVLEKPPGRSLFAITFDWNKARVDKTLAKDKLQKWINISFPGYNMPERTFEIILEVQPMYDKGNLWLAALGSFNSTVKHKSYVGEETFDMELKEAEWIRLKSEDIVRKSCQEVERLVFFFLSIFKTLKRDVGSEHPTSRSNEEEGRETKAGEEEGGMMEKLEGGEGGEKQGKGRKGKGRKEGEGRERIGRGRKEAGKKDYDKKEGTNKKGR